MRLLFITSLFVFALFFSDRVSAQPQPEIVVWLDPGYGQVVGYNWPIGLPVTVTVDDPLTVESPDYTETQSPQPCDFDPERTCTRFDFHSLNDQGIRPGYMFTMTNGETTKKTVVEYLTVTGSNVDTDTVFGTAGPGKPVYIWVCRERDCGINLADRSITADGVGNWTANFADQGGGTVYDVTRFDQFSMTIHDDDRDGTQMSWGIPVPFLAANLTENKVYGYAWEMGTSVTLEIDDPNTSEPVDYTDTTTVTEPWYKQGQVAFDLGSFTLQPGQTVRMSDAYITRIHIVISNLSVTAVSVENDTIAGTANPGSLILVGEMCWWRNCAWSETTADDNGNWQVVFFWDITPDSSQKAWQREEDGDLTEVVWSAPNVDSDGDGINDYIDSCPEEDSTGFDADQNGCLDNIQGLSQVIDTLPDDALSEEIKNSLTSKVSAALNSIDKEKDQAAINQLQAFIMEINAQREKKISEVAADLLISYANNIISRIQAG